MLRQISTPEILLALGMICLLYLAVLLVKKVDFAVIWLPVGSTFLAVGGYWRYRMFYPQGFRLPDALAICIVTALLAGTVVFLLTEYRIVQAMFSRTEADLEVLVVLGAQVRGEAPSRALLRRLEAAYRYLRENERTVAVLTGGQGDGEDITEALCMFRYLTEQGIAPERLNLEEASTTTKENLCFASKKIAGYFAAQKEAAAFAGLEKDDGMGYRTGILSNNFHVYRASLIAHKMGYSKVYPIAARSDWRLQIHYLVREFFALLKAKWLGHI